MRRSAFLLTLLAAAPVAAQYGPQPGADPDRNRPAALRDIGLDQRLDQPIPLDARFRDEAGRDLALGNCFSGKPVVLVLVQYRCAMLCNQVLNGLVECLRNIGFDAGNQFQVVVVSFDARERPDLAAEKKQSYLGRYDRPGAENGWHFLTGEQASIDRLTQATGFRYHYDATTDQFAHPSGILILTPRGRIARYFYGIHYSPRDVRLGLIEASENRIGAPSDQVLLFCFHYDPTAGKYSAAVLRLVRVGGVFTVLALGAFVALTRRAKRDRITG